MRGGISGRKGRGKVPYDPQRWLNVKRTQKGKKRLNEKDTVGRGHGIQHEIPSKKRKKVRRKEDFTRGKNLSS